MKAITYITTCHDKQTVLTLLCSLLNTVCVWYFCVASACTNHLYRRSNIIRLHGKFRTIMSCGKIPSRFWLFTAYSFFSCLFCIRYLKMAGVHLRRTTIVTTLGDYTGLKISNSSWTE